ncbi:flagellar basal body protein FliL [Hwanghaeella grinnelliae]|uniref:Flagellar protein FliL n=1 Tax=Hwanghaeella grinnelliae TaxID=2500179 RepID=A0A3S3UM00_9PROT|nr:flagellar basal body-associated FliL family protein [Hwanghaeella grinnelliae]RVU34651.1 flagellar basal body protein FliL [Hwanghaeella grinnelliae]
MSEEVEDGEGEEGGKKKVGGKKLVLFIVLPILILVGAGAGLYFSGMLDSLLGGEEQHEGEEHGEEHVEEPAVATPGFYLEVPEMLVSLRSSGRKQQILKLRISLELAGPEDQAAIEAFMPKIVDNFQVFLRELRVEELEGSQGLYRIKEEMLARVNQAAHPVKIKDVLIGDMLIQ